MKELVMSHEEIVEAVTRIGKELTEFLKNDAKPPLFVCVLKGAANFALDLVAQIKIPLFLDFVQVSSYEGVASTGHIHMKKELSNPEIQTDTVVIVEDIVDTGLTMAYLVEHLQNMLHPQRIIVTALLDKICARKNDVRVDFRGKALTEDKFVVGYGLDYKELFRNVPYIYVPESKEIKDIDSALEKSI